MKPKVYIAGPISRGNQFHNVAEGCKFWRELFRAGFHPVAPHWSAVQDLVAPVSYDDYLAHDLEIIETCDAVLRLPGDSHGADREVAHAEDHGIPVYTDLALLVAARDRLVSVRLADAVFTPRVEWEAFECIIGTDDTEPDTADLAVKLEIDGWNVESITPYTDEWDRPCVLALLWRETA